MIQQVHEQFYDQIIFSQSFGFNRDRYTIGFKLFLPWLIFNIAWIFYPCMNTRNNGEWHQFVLMCPDICQAGFHFLKILITIHCFYVDLTTRTDIVQDHLQLPESRFGPSFSGWGYQNNCIIFFFRKIEAITPQYVRITVFI